MPILAVLSPVQMTYGRVILLLTEMVQVVKIFDDNVPAFKFEIHVQKGKLRPLVATGSFAPVDTVATSSQIAMPTAMIS